MFKRKDALRTLFLTIVIITIMITLSQILVVHRKSHANKSRETSRVQTMMMTFTQLEKAIESMMKKEFVAGDKYKEYFKSFVYTINVRKLLREAAVGEQRKKKLRRTYRERTNLLKPGNSKSEQSAEAKYQNTSNLKFKQDRTLKHIKEDGRLERVTGMFAVIEDEYLNNSGTVQRFEKGLSERLSNIHQNTEEIYNREKHQLTNNHISVRKDKTIRKCPSIENKLGNLTTDQLTESPDISYDMGLGGVWKPKNCVPNQRVAIIIPYRAREKHLQMLLHNLIPVLKQQLLNFRIFVIEQFGETTFNKGRLMNAGFTEAWGMGNFDCFIFHDVDLLPESDINTYTCGDHPRHMSIAVDKFGYRLPYMTLVGGVFAIKPDQFLQVNGYSNLYWGWGAEDDDMAVRLRASRLTIERPPTNVGRYKMIKHDNRETAPVKIRAYLLKTVRKRFHKDGLNTLDYKVMFINNTKLFTHIMVNVGSVPKEAADITRMLS